MSLYLSVVQLYASEVISLGLLVLEDNISMQSVPWYVYRYSNATITNNSSQLLLKSLVGMCTGTVMQPLQIIHNRTSWLILKSLVELS